MSYSERSEFLEKYLKLCRDCNYYIDTGFRQPLYIMKMEYPQDFSFEKTVERLQEDVG